MVRGVTIGKQAVMLGLSVVLMTALGGVAYSKDDPILHLEEILTEIGAQHTTTQGAVGAAQTAIQGTVQTESTAVQNAMGAVQTELTTQHGMVKQDMTDLETRLNEKIDAKIQEILDILTLPCGLGTQGTRFVVNGPEVCDNTTGTRWQRVLDTQQRTWQGSKDYCAGLDLGNGQTYRLAEVAEYQTLLPLLAPDLNAPTGPFTNVQSGSYWSATSSASNPADAWLVTFSGGDVLTTFKTITFFVWCARSGS